MGNFNKFIKASTELDKLAGHILSEVKPCKTKRQQYMVMAVNKIFNLFKSIKMLDSNGYLREAAQLVRSQIELQFVTQYVFQDKTDKRLEKYLDYYNVYRKKLYDNLKANDLELELFKTFKDILIGEKFTEEDIQKYAESAQLKHHYPRHGWSNKSLYQMIDETNGMEFYRHYYYLYSEAIHSSIANLYEYFPSHQKGESNMYLLMTNTMVSFLTCILIFQRFCKEFKLPMINEVEDLMERLGLEIERDL